MADAALSKDESQMTVPRPAIFELAKRLIESGDERAEVGDLSAEECHELDMIAFECIECNWWFHQRDNATKDGDEWICKSCNGG